MYHESGQLQRVIWHSASILRNTYPEDYPKYLIGLLFLKMVHDDRARWSIPEELNWNGLLESGHAERFQSRLKHLGTLSPTVAAAIEISRLSDLPHVLGEDLFTILRLLGDIDLAKVPPSSLHDSMISIYEHSRSPHYTSERVSKLLAKLVRPSGALTIYDPTCGTGRLLLNTYLEATAENGGAPIRLYGQEIDRDTALTASLLLALYGRDDAEIRIGDTLLSPHFFDETGKIKRFDIIVTELPFSVRVPRPRLDTLSNDPRFSFGLAPIADWLFVQHIIASLGEKSRAAILMTPGALFRSGSERAIRQSITESDIIEAVIELPNNVLRSTGIAPVVLLLNKNKPSALRKRILFVNAKREFSIYHDRTIIDDENLQRIVDVVTNIKNLPGFSCLVDLDKVVENNYLLSPATYLHITDERRVGFLLKHSSMQPLQHIADVLPGTRAGRETVLKGEGDTPIIQGRNLAAFGLSVDDLDRIRVVGELSNEVFAQRGDILLQRIGEHPSAYLVDEKLDGTLVWDTVYVIRLHDEFSHLGRFLVEYLNSSLWYEYLQTRQMRSAGPPTLSLSMVRESEVPVPQREWALTALVSLDSLFEAERDIQDRFRTLRQIRQQLFTTEDQQAFEESIEKTLLRERIVSQTVQQAEGLDYQIRNLFPHMLAYPYRTLDSATQYSQKYQEQLRVGENLMAFFGSIGLQLLFHLGLHKSDDAEWLRSALGSWWNGGIAPGDWHEMGRRSAQSIRQSNVPGISAIANVWFKGQGSRPSDFRKNLQRLGEMLNDFKHSRGPKTPREYKENSEEAHGLLRECLEQVSLLTQYPIHQVISSSQDWKTQQMVVRTLVHMGDHPGLRQHETTLTVPVSDDHLYIAIDSDNWISLYPLITVQYCPSCQQRETYMIDRWDGFGQRFLLKSFERGHTLDTSKNDSEAMAMRDDFEHFFRVLTEARPQ